MPASITMARVASRPNVAGQQQADPRQRAHARQHADQGADDAARRTRRRGSAATAPPRSPGPGWTASPASEPEGAARQLHAQQRVEQVVGAGRHPDREQRAWSPGPCARSRPAGTRTPRPSSAGTRAAPGPAPRTRRCPGWRRCAATPASPPRSAPSAARSSTATSTPATQQREREQHRHVGGPGVGEAAERQPGTPALLQHDGGQQREGDAAEPPGGHRCADAPPRSAPASAACRGAARRAGPARPPRR